MFHLYDLKNGTIKPEKTISLTWNRRILIEINEFNGTIAIRIANPANTETPSRRHRKNNDNPTFKINLFKF